MNFRISFQERATSGLWNSTWGHFQGGMQAGSCWTGKITKAASGALGFAPCPPQRCYPCPGSREPVSAPPDSQETRTQSPPAAHPTGLSRSGAFSPLKSALKLPEARSPGLPRRAGAGGLALPDPCPPPLAPLRSRQRNAISSQPGRQDRPNHPAQAGCSELSAHGAGTALGEGGPRRPQAKATQPASDGAGPFTTGRPLPCSQEAAVPSKGPLGMELSSTSSPSRLPSPAEQTHAPSRDPQLCPRLQHHRALP